MKNRSRRTLFLTLTVIISCIWLCTNAEEEELEEAITASIDQKIIKQTMTGYDHRVRPAGLNKSAEGTGGPVKVDVNILIRMLSKIDDVNMEYSMQITFRENWYDPRLAYGRKDIGKQYGKDLPEFVVLSPGTDIWMPDTFFPTEKQGNRHMIDKPNVLLRIYSDGKILYSVRLSLVLSCPMFLHYFPMDVQTCNFDLISYAYTTKDIEYAWRNDTPIQQVDNLNMSLPRFELSNITTSECTSTTVTGTYGCLRMQLRLARQFSYYVLQLYMPSTMLVIVSWISFWLDRKSAPARVALGVMTLLTMSTQQAGINAKLPPVAYTKAVDIWIGACLTFIFGALLEYAFVSYMDNHKKPRKEKSDDDENILKGTKQHSVACRRLQKMLNRARGKGGGGARLRTLSVRNQTATSEAPTTDCGLPVAELTGAGEPHCTCLMLNVREPLLPTNGVYDSNWNAFDQQKGALLGSPALSDDPQSPAYVRVGASHAGGWRQKLRLRWKRCFNVPKEKPKRIDFLSRFIFPAGFLLFNIVYWSIVLTKIAQT